MNIEDLRKYYRDDIIAIADKYGVEKVRVFGSFVRGEQNDDSDIDFLVRFGPKMTLLRWAAFERELRETIGRDVDVVSERGINPLLKDTILSEAREL